MPVTQRKRSFQLFRKLKFCSSPNDDESTLEMDKMILHCLDCLGALQCLMGKYDAAKSKVFWSAVSTIADLGIDTLAGNMDRRHPGAIPLMRVFPNDAKATDGRGWLPLHWAAVSDNVTVEDVKYVAIQDPLATLKGCSLPISANPGHLIAASRHPDMKVVKCLYDFYPRMASTRDNFGDLPIHYAARYSQSTEMIRYLLQANPNSTKVHGDGDLVPLQCAIYNQYEESKVQFIQILLTVDKTAARIINSDGDTALHLMVDNDCDEKLVKMIIDAYPDALRIPNDVGMLPLHTSCYSKKPGAENVVKLLLKEYPKAAHVQNINGLLAAHIAAEYSTVPILQAILEAFPSALSVVNEGCGTPLHQAVNGNNYDTAVYLAKNFPEICQIQDSYGLLPFHCALMVDNYSIIKSLYEAYPEALFLDTPSKDSALALFLGHQDHIGEKTPEAECLRFLLRHHPSAVTQVNADGISVLSFPVAQDPFVRRLLLYASPQSDSQNELRVFNYEQRRMAMFVAFDAMNANGEPTILCRLREANLELLKHVVSYL